MLKSLDLPEVLELPRCELLSLETVTRYCPLGTNYDKHMLPSLCPFRCPVASTEWMLRSLFLVMRFRTRSSIDVRTRAHKTALMRQSSIIGIVFVKSL